MLPHRQTGLHLPSAVPSQQCVSELCTSSHLMMTVPQSHPSAAEASEVLAYCTETRTQQRVSSGVAKIT